MRILTPPRRARGFSLIELLVVIGIIALLVGILLPVLGRARGTATEAACLSNQRQLAAAALAYSVDHAARLPSAGNLSPTLTQHASWTLALVPYLDADLPTLARCPSDTSPRWDTPDPGSGLRRLASFGTNFYLSGLLPGYKPFAHLNRVPNPSLTVFAVELTEAGSYAVSDHIHAENWALDPYNRAAAQIALTRHGGRSTYSHLDGSARSHTLAEVYELDPASTFGNWVWTRNRLNPTIAR